ncbi:MAG: glycoside hydrolase family 127 protein [Bacteroidia bacterium]|nr:glycoside hydrolase family 127 protein [Bacteroidia bacterium]
MKTNNKTTSESSLLEQRIAERISDKIHSFQRRNFLKTVSILGGSTLLSQFAWASSKKVQKVLAIKPLRAESGQKVITKDVFKPLDLGQVNVGGEIGRRIDITVNNNLLVLDVDKDFLLPFQQKNHEGKGYSDYVGLGKFIDAAVRFAAYTKSEKVMTLKKHIVDEIIKTQEPDGYIGIMVKESRMWRLWDIHEMGYIIMGLTSDYHYFGEKRSLIAAQKLADYIIERWPTMPDSWEKWGNIGLESNLLTLYRETEDKRYLDFCVRQLALPEWNLVLDINTLIKGHMYTDIDLCLAQLDLFHFQPNERLLRSSRCAIEFLTFHDCMTITGAAGLWESWTDDQGGREYLGETCATAYQIRLFDRFLRMEGNSRYGDILERIIYNALFGVQSPDGRYLRYFMPLEGDRIYFPSDTYCCPNNFRRIVSELPTIVFYRSARGVAVNLYTRSEATISLDESVLLKIRQQTDYPSSGNVMISLDPSKPARFPLQLRIPSWCGKATVSVNGKTWEGPIASGEFLSLERQWSAGDQVSLDMPMPFRFVLGRRRQFGHVAVMRGPRIFCLNPAQNIALQKKDAADLTNFIIDPSSLKLLPDDSTVHPGGVACSVMVANRSITLGPLMPLKFTEFPDPEGKVVYFRIPDFSVAVHDEILSGNSHEQ